MEDDSEFEKAEAKKTKTRVNIFDDNVSYPLLVISYAYYHVSRFDECLQSI